MRLAASLIVLLCLALLFAAVVWWRSGERARAVNAATPPMGELIEVRGRTVHALVRGTGPDVVLLHGASGNLRDWLPMIERLEGRYRVIAMDRPGLGWTERADIGLFETRTESPEAQAALLAEAARQLGAERPVVVGHSFAGSLALAWALDQGPAAVVSLSGVAMPWPGGLGTLYRVTDGPVLGGIVPPVLTAFATEGMVEAAIVSIFEPDPAPEGYADLSGARLILDSRRYRVNARQVNGLRPQIVAQSARYGEISVPVEIVHGTEDTIVPPDVHAIPLSRAVPGANLVLLEGTGHMPHHATPEAVEAAIDRAAARAGLR